MKASIFLLSIAIVVVILSCQSTENAPIEGTYIRFSQHEFGTEYDTLVLTPQNREAGQFQILRKWKYERITDGGGVQPKYQRKKTTGVFDRKKRILQESESGDAYHFNDAKATLAIGSTVYQKIK